MTPETISILSNALEALLLTRKERFYANLSKLSSQDVQDYRQDQQALQGIADILDMHLPNPDTDGACTECGSTDVELCTECGQCPEHCDCLA